MYLALFQILKASQKSIQKAWMYMVLYPPHFSSSEPTILVAAFVALLNMPYDLNFGIYFSAGSL